MKTKTGKKFKRFIRKFCPRHFNKLLKYTVFNDQKLAKFEKVIDTGICQLGCVVEKDNDGYFFGSRIVYDGQETGNSWATFGFDFEFVDGRVNSFGLMPTWTKDVDGVYHGDLLMQILENDNWEWDEGE
jgi:hypothetical protein